MSGLRLRLIPLSGAVLLAAGCVEPAPPPAQQAVAEVTTAKAVVGDLPLTIVGFGTVQFDPAGQLTLVAEIEARVLELAVQPGQLVERADVVLKLGPSSGSGVELVRSRRDAQAAEAAAARARRLRSDGLASDADVEAAENAAKDLVTLADSLEKRAGNISSLRAPIAGIVDAILVSPGDLVSPGTQLARIASPAAIQARISVEIEDVVGLTIGDPVQLRALDNRGTTLESRIGMIDYRVDPATRMASVTVPVPANGGLLAGGAVRASITVDTRREVVLVPRNAVFEDEAGAYLFTASQGTATLRRVQKGETALELVEIRAGLEPGETVIVEGAAVLSDGMPVREGWSAEGAPQ